MQIITTTAKTPVDHATEAREFLAAAASQPMHLDEHGSYEAQAVQAQALIGIGHALLAVATELRNQREAQS